MSNLVERVITGFGPEDAAHYGIVQWCELNGIDVWHVPNSTYTKSPMVRIKNTLLGVKPGILDLWFPIADVGLVVIELKRKKVKGRHSNYPTKAQRVWIEKLNKVPGVQAFVCYGGEEAVAKLLEYLPTKPRYPFVPESEISNMVRSKIKAVGPQAKKDIQNSLDTIF